MSYLTPNTGNSTYVDTALRTSDIMPQPGFFVDAAQFPVRFDLEGGTSAKQGAALVQAQEVGVYDVISLLDRLILVEVSPGIVEFDTTGTAVAQFVENGAGRYDVSDDLTEAEDAAFYALGDNDRYAIASIGGIEEGLSIVTTGGTAAQLYL